MLRRSPGSMLPPHPGTSAGRQHTLNEVKKRQPQQPQRALVASPDEMAAGIQERDELFIDPQGGGIKRRAKVDYF